MVVPAVKPDTKPVASTVATAGAELLQTPPEVGLDNCVVLPIQALSVPFITVTIGNELIVTGKVTAVSQPFALVTV